MPVCIWGPSWVVHNLFFLLGHLSLWVESEQVIRLLGLSAESLQCTIQQTRHNWFQGNSSHTCTLHLKLSVIGKQNLIFSYDGAMSKLVQRYILRFHIFWNLWFLLCKLLEGFDIKTVFSWNNGLLNCLYTNTLHRFPKFNSLFSQNQLSTDLFWCNQWNNLILRMQCPI